MKKISNNIFFITLIFGTLVTISSNSWLGAWMGLEINLLSFIPLMNDNKKNLLTSESSLKYFLTQAFASSILLFAIITLMFIYNNNFLLLNNYNEILILSTLLLKSGAAPFHFWFPEVMEGLSWINGLILMTWQKIAPLMLISYNFIYNFFMISIILSMLIGSLGGLNQTSIRKLMAFSSINHLGWMLLAMMNNEMLWMTYFLMYSFLSFSIVLMFNNFKLFYFNQIFNITLMNPIMKLLIFLNLLSLGGLPPFLGFLPKWLVIQNLTNMSQFFILIISVCLTLITLFFYLRLSYSIFMLNYQKNSWLLKNNYTNKLSSISIIFNFISISGLILIFTIYMIM
uniref:NADH-ubiquinone oxidoreductase chain 2 n=2 Tax=Anopheles incertae sedis TaxID=190374 RepID=A0A343WC10_9DIPT|nr:NADH dehydrogenase subunit 2 [Anopheles costai]YP_009487966.1 NADH dehydrogenase subunit 2 [Anopheles nr. costai SP02_17_3]AWB98212.1 NADH dehydrogenase subunit 2 [Anopheles costai]AWB98251.1 NADH dehydrogenase subunit 2 [Anopheles costai]AWB99499.1 NADH dehydrogenase subunit 2 [Anopheles nr. costai SP02_17_3]